MEYLLLLFALFLLENLRSNSLNFLECLYYKALLVIFDGETLSKAFAKFK